MDLEKNISRTAQRPAWDGEPQSDTSEDSDAIMVSMEPSEDPYNWKTSKKMFIVIVATTTSINSTMGTALTSNLTEYLLNDFGIPDGLQKVLPASVYLLGFVCGPLVLAPLSESYGRRPIMLSGFLLYVVDTLACAFAPNWPVFLILRFLAGVFAAPPQSVMGGVLADIFRGQRARGRAMMVWSAMAIVGPLTAPIIAGFTGQYNWRWTFRIATMIAGVTLMLVLFLPETLASKLLRTKAARLNKQTNSQRYVSPDDIDRISTWRFLKITMSRPFRIIFMEPIVLFTGIYMAFVYAVFYMLLVIFPDIFEGIYHFSPGYCGVAFTMLGLGTCFACMAHLWYDGRAAEISEKHPDHYAEYLRLPIACAGGPAFVLSLFWLGWTARTSVPWVVPLLATIPYGFAYQMIFMAMFNYISDAYGIYAASALAGMGAMRSVVGAILPLGVSRMISSLGIAWSCSLLGFISLGLSILPFCFMIWGPQIRRASKLTSALQAGGGGSGDNMLTRSISLI